MKDEIKKYLEAQEKWLKETGVTIGSKVLVVSSAVGQSYGWTADWVPPMDNAIGKTFKVTAIYRGDETTSNGDVTVTGIAAGWNFPFFVLVRCDDDN